jgi:ApaG protein
VSTRSSETTNGVHVRVQSRYVPSRSNPEGGEWFFMYTVRITNQGDDVVQLVSRHWIIRDAAGREQEVRGPGVVGAQPVLEPGQAFEYTSFCPLPTSSGTMHGSFQMVTAEGEGFDAAVAPFVLSEELEFS